MLFGVWDLDILAARLEFLFQSAALTTNTSIVTNKYFYSFSYLASTANTQLNRTLLSLKIVRHDMVASSSFFSSKPTLDDLVWSLPTILPSPSHLSSNFDTFLQFFFYFCSTETIIINILSPVFWNKPHFQLISDLFFVCWQD